MRLLDSLSMATAKVILLLVAAMFISTVAGEVTKGFKLPCVTVNQHEFGNCDLR